MSRLGAGTWQLGGSTLFGGRRSGYGDVDEADCIRGIHLALDRGLNFFDTADTYGHGRSEELLGKALKGRRYDGIVCTKFGNREDAEGNAFQDYSAEWLNTSVDGSLKRLGRDHLDILLLHSPPDDFDWADYDSEPFESLVKAGKIRSYGISNRSVYGAQAAAEAGFGYVFQVIYNAMDRRAEEVLMPLLSEEQTLMARSPLGSGFLSDKRTTGPAPEFAEDDHRAGLPDEPRIWLYEQARELRQLLEDGQSLEELAIRFCLTHPLSHSCIPGFKSSAQMEANIDAGMKGPLSADVVAEIERIVPDVFPGWRR